jgi:hypothetical protein
LEVYERSVSSNSVFGLALLVAANVTGIQRVALAGPPVSVSVLANGNCPSAQQVENALAARAIQPGGSEYSVSIQTGSSHVTVQLQRLGGEPLLTRSFSSEDCSAVAEAAAVVVEAYFIEVSGGTAVPLRSGGESQPVALPLPVHESGPERASPPESTRAGGVSTVTPLHEPEVFALPVQGRVLGPFANGAPILLPQAAPAGSARTRGYFEVGPFMMLPAAAANVQIGAGAGIDWNRVPMFVELGLATSLPSVTGDVPRRVRRWANQAVMRVGAPMGNGRVYRPWLGVGAMLAELRAVDVPSAPTKVSTSALLGTGLQLAWPIKDSWSGHLDFSCLVLTSRDSYRVQPEGEIGRGPRVVCAAMLGVATGGTAGR